MPAPSNPSRSLPRFICLTGIDGCGKSTHIRRLTDRASRDFGWRVAVVSVWDIARHPAYQTHPFIADKAAIYAYLGNLHPGARTLFILHALSESLDLALDQNPDLIIADGFWYKYVFSESLHGGALVNPVRPPDSPGATGAPATPAPLSEPYSGAASSLPGVGELYAAAFPVPERTLFLDLTAERAWARKPALTPYECGMQTPGETTFIAFQRRLRTVMQAAAARHVWRTIDVDRPENEVAGDIWAALSLKNGHS